MKFKGFSYKTSQNWLLIPPLACLIAYFLENHWPPFMTQDSWKTIPWSVAGMLFWFALTVHLGLLKNAQPSTSSEIKIFGEQVKLSVGLFNAIAIGLLAITFVRPLTERFAFGLKEGFLVIVAMLFHIHAHRIIACMKFE